AASVDALRGRRAASAAGGAWGRGGPAHVSGPEFGAAARSWRRGRSAHSGPKPASWGAATTKLSRFPQPQQCITSWPTPPIGNQGQPGTLGAPFRLGSHSQRGKRNRKAPGKTGLLRNGSHHGSSA